MRKIYSRACVIALLVCASLNAHTQVSTYTFASSSGTFSSIVGGVGTVEVATTGFDQSFGALPIGFTFTYNGNAYTTFGLNMNGFICMGSAVPISTDHALSSGLNNNVISGFNGSLYGNTPGAKISYQTSGSAGSRILTVEWTSWGFFSSGANEFNFQIRLSEGTNKIQVVYGSCPGNTSATLQVGLRGQTNADFNNRTTLLNWAATTPGVTNSANCTYNSTVKPSSGLQFEWTPSAVPRVCGTITAIQLPGTAPPGSNNNAILRISIPVTGTSGTLTLSSITVASKNTSDNDISTGGVKIWTGTASAPVTQVGSGVSFSAGTATISSLNTSLITGTNYIWITFDVKTTAVVGHVLDAKINGGAISISASGGAVNPGTQPTTQLNPGGAKTVNYCTPFSTYGGCDGDQIAGFTFAGINYTGGCVQSPGYVDVATTATTTQGQPYNFTLTFSDVSDYGAIWIDFNNNTSFDDAGELVYSGGPGTSQAGTIMIPATTSPGTHRVRVRDNYDAPLPSPCDSILLGETKDFRVLVNAATNCTGTPAASNTLSTINPVCADVSFTLSLSVQYLNLGITYQWQSSSNGSNYNNISGETSYTYTGTQTVATYYRCKITCTNSGQSVFSSGLLEGLNPFNNCYCTPLGADCTDDQITSVVFGGINNTSACSTDGYGDYSSQTGAASQGTSQSISVGVSNGGTEHVTAWIDYNHNSVFDLNEQTYIGSGIGQTITTNIQIPPTALSGITRMRIRLEFAFQSVNPCDSFDYGETEDYSVNISGCSQATYYADSDNDNYGNPNISQIACSQPTGYVLNSTDCNDSNPAVHPGVAETCNNIDDNCNSQVDEGLTQHTYYADADNDGYGNASSSISICQTTPPAGYVTGSTDCNDANGAVHPGVTETCNNIDDNCNTQVDEGLTQHTYYADADNDGYGNASSSISTCQTTPPAGYVTGSTDCNDANGAVHPGVTEACNGIDDNCNTQTDEGCSTFTYFADTDQDGYGNPNSSIISNNPTPPPGYVTNNTDCNDANGSVHPGATEICNSIDDNCNSQIDEGVVTATISPSGSVTICSGTSLLMQANTGAGLTYKWRKNGSNISGATNSSYSTNKAGSYTVIVTSGTCSATSAATTVSVVASPSATVTPSGSVTVCPGTSVTLQANTGAGLTYQWANSTGNIAGATSSSYTTSVKSGYRVTVANTSGCSKTSSSTKLKNFAAVQVQITNSGSLNICSSGSVTLNAKVVAGYAYQWYKDNVTISGATGTSYVATQAGVYKYLATSPDGCTKFSPTKTVSGCRLEVEADEEILPSLTLYPNPNNGRFVIGLQLSSDVNAEAKVQIISTLGQSVYLDHAAVVNGELRGELNLNGIVPAGNYFVRVIVDDQVYTGRLMLQR